MLNQVLASDCTIVIVWSKIIYGYINHKSMVYKIGFCTNSRSLYIQQIANFVSLSNDQLSHH